MKRDAEFSICEETETHVVIRDTGSPWRDVKTVTNDAEQVVRRLATMVGDRRLYYHDSHDDLDELRIKDGEFAGFRIGGPPPQQGK